MALFPTTINNQAAIQSAFDPAAENIGPFPSLRQLSSQALYQAGRSLVSTMMGLSLQLDILYKAPFPAGPFILASNHPTTTDPFYLLLLLKNPASVLVMGGAFEVPLFGSYLRAAGHVPAVRGSGGATVDALVRVIESGRSAAIFPEGALTPLKGEIGRPHSGLARVALRTGAPVIPVGIGLDRDRIRVTQINLKDGPVTGHLYLSGPYAITIGRPIQLKGSPADREAVKAASALVMDQIKTLAAESDQRLRLVTPGANHQLPSKLRTEFQAAR